MRIHKTWRRFRPRTVEQSSSVNLFRHVEADVMKQLDTLPVRRFRGVELSELAPLIRHARQRAEESHQAQYWLSLLLLLTPRTVALQRQMDKHPARFSSGDANLLELIDFNDVYVSSVLSLPDNLLADFNDEMKRMMDRLCKRLHSSCFSNEQFEAITKGLTREIAVYRGALREGLQVEMTSRAQDAMGVDLVVSDDAGRSLNIDVKTRSSFHFRIKDLVREGRVTEHQANLAEDMGYCAVVNGHGTDRVHVILLRIDPESLGEISHFAFENAHQLGVILRDLLHQFGETDITG